MQIIPSVDTGRCVSNWKLVNLKANNCFLILVKLTKRNISS